MMLQDCDASEQRALISKMEATLAMVGVSDFGNCFLREPAGGRQFACCPGYQSLLIPMDELQSALDRLLQRRRLLRCRLSSRCS
jgi:hypothetical protein